jgi:hypothetical protein
MAKLAPIAAAMAVEIRLFWSCCMNAPVFGLEWGGPAGLVDRIFLGSPKNNE